MNLPKVFIIILNWNGLKDTLECLESVFKLDYKNFEVIVVDNGSMDNSAAIIREKYPQVILIENKENLGYTGGNNLAMHYAMEKGADYMWLLNNDTVVEASTLSKLVTAAEKSSDIGLISPVIYYFDEPSRVQFKGEYVDWGNYSIRKIEKPKLWENEKVRENIILWGTALLIKRSVVKSVGCLNEKYFAYHEDCEYSIKVAKAGYKNIIDFSAKIYHKDSGSTGSRESPLQTFLRVRNIYFFWMENIKQIKKGIYFCKYLSFAISNAANFIYKNLDESVNACFDGAWNAIYGIGGSPLRRKKKTPYIFKKILSYHPYLWASVFRGDFSHIISEAIKRIKLVFKNKLP